MAVFQGPSFAGEQITMTRDDIIRMAREAGLSTAYAVIAEHPDGTQTVLDHRPFLERFAALVAAHTLSNIDPSSFMSWQEGYAAGAAAEREACAKVAEDFDGPDRYVDDIAAAIRARGATK